jgi:hypothetical protein
VPHANPQSNPRAVAVVAIRRQDKPRPVDSQPLFHLSSAAVARVSVAASAEHLSSTHTHTPPFSSLPPRASLPSYRIATSTLLDRLFPPRPLPPHCLRIAAVLLVMRLGFSLFDLQRTLRPGI